MELTAVQLGCRATRFAKQCLGLLITRTVIWTDAQDVLHFLASEERHPVYIRNRLIAIKAMPGLECGQLIPEEEPTLIVSSAAQELFTRLVEPSKWPKLAPCFVKYIRVVAIVHKFVKKAAASAKIVLKQVVGDVNYTQPLPLNASWSSKVAHVTELTPEELENAEMLSFKCAQNEQPPTEKLIRSLDLNCPLLIVHIHWKAKHAGPGITLCELRRNFWVPQGRRTVTNTLKSGCLVCRRWDAKPFKAPPMPDLPSSRVNPSDPFKHIGLDYAGPFYIFEGPKRAPTKNFKVWVLIVTCLAVRAVHLETALDCTAVAFLNAFRKFVARRGMPRTIVSDNGTNFVAAEKATRIAWAPKRKKKSATTWSSTK
uniref:Integrase catalytic domain-containing protein n=1 Tax=Ditylenchus dipsaci TaxID=166011 RepID=A0A915D6X9_9BILA